MAGPESQDGGEIVVRIERVVIVPPPNVERPDHGGIGCGSGCLVVLALWLVLSVLVNRPA